MPQKKSESKNLVILVPIHFCWFSYLQSVTILLNATQTLPNSYSMLVKNKDRQCTFVVVRHVSVLQTSPPQELECSSSRGSSRRRVTFEKKYTHVIEYKHYAFWYHKNKNKSYPRTRPLLAPLLRIRIRKKINFLIL